MDYYNIGQRIRKFRKAQGLSQEELAEKVNISTTHMSHIETGNTKLSLPVFVDITKALGVRANELLDDVDWMETAGKERDEILSVVEQCTAHQAKIIAEIVKATKLAMDKFE